MGLLTAIGISIMAEHVGKSIVRTAKDADMERASMEAASRERCVRMIAESEVEKARIRAMADVVNTAMLTGQPINPALMSGNNGTQYIGSMNSGGYYGSSGSYGGSYNQSGGERISYGNKNSVYGNSNYYNGGYGQYNRPVYAIEGSTPSKRYCPCCGSPRNGAMLFCDKCGMEFS